MVTGDLTHIGLPDEFAEAAQWLPCLGPAEQVTVIPGNHEAYAGHDWSKNLISWAPYLLSDSKPENTKLKTFSPALRIRGQIALIGLCSARPSLPFFAIGSLGKKQLQLLAKLLKETGEAGLMRVVLVHHPPVPGTTDWRKRLVDDKAFSDVVRHHGAELVLHGHTHTSTLRELQGPAGTNPGGWRPISLGTESAERTLRRVQSLSDKTKRFELGSEYDCQTLFGQKRPGLSRSGKLPWANHACDQKCHQVGSFCRAV